MGKNVLAVGYAGSGKSTQFLALPGKKFAYAFEKHAADMYEEWQVPHKAFLPDDTEINMAVRTLRKKIGDEPSRKKLEPKVYENWLDDFIARSDDGFFRQIDWLCFDSFTTWSYSILDRLGWLNKRPGHQPQQDDWAAQVNIISQVWRVLGSLPCNVYCTAHLEMMKNDTSGRTYNHLMMTGKLKVRIPLLFNNIFVHHVEEDKKGAFFTIQTIPDREFPNVRTSIRGLEKYEDVTLDFDKPLEGQGLAAILASQKPPVIHKKKEPKK